MEVTAQDDESSSWTTLPWIDWQGVRCDLLTFWRAPHNFQHDPITEDHRHLDAEALRDASSVSQLKTGSETGADPRSDDNVGGMDIEVEGGERDPGDNIIKCELVSLDLFLS